MFKIFSRIKRTYRFSESVLINSSTGLDTAFTIVEAKLEQGWDKVVSTLSQRCFNVAHRRCINVVQRWKFDVGFCFIFNVGSTLFQRWSATLKQRWSDVEMLTGFTIKRIRCRGKNQDYFYEVSVLYVEGIKV